MLIQRPRIQRLLEAAANIERVEAHPAGPQLTVLSDPGAAAQPLVIRKARAMALLLRTVPIHIYPDELIVGLPFRETPAAGPGDEATARLLPPQGVAGEGYIAEARRYLAEGRPLVPYSPDLSGTVPGVASARYGALPTYTTAAERAEAARFGLAENSNPGHLQVGHANVLREGWSGLRARAAAQLAGQDRSKVGGRRRSDWLEAVMIALDGARDLALRYAELAEQMAADEGDGHRKDELSGIAAVCKSVTTGRPKTFREALQLHWLTHLVALNQGARQIGRFDQYLWPFLAADLAAGRTDLEQARELVECLWLKYGQVTAVTEDNLQNIIVGGVTEEGADGTNPLTYICLEASERLGLVDPKMSVRLHRGSPQDLLRCAAALAAAGRCHPGFYNDEVIIPALAATGIPLHHARDYTNDGCSELLVQGRTNPWCFEAKVQVLRCLEMVLQERDDYVSFEELWTALGERLAWAVDLAVANANLLQVAVQRISPNPFVSVTVEGCLERMADLTEGGAMYNPAAVCASGLADTADALAVLCQLVFRDRAVTLAELTAALTANFAGAERLRLMLLHRAPKFGNDDDEVDRLAVALVEHLAAAVRGRRNPRGGQYVLGLFSYGDYIGHGLMTGATPDGRPSGAGISANFSPAPGRDTEGPFAVLQSTAKVDPILTPNGRAVDITIHPSAVSGPDGVDKLAGLLRAFVAVGEMQVQFSFADAGILRAAQRDPERYRNLTVRLWGFPAHFVGLPREFQDHIIARTAHGTV